MIRVNTEEQKKKELEEERQRQRKSPYRDAAAKCIGPTERTRSRSRQDKKQDRLAARIRQRQVPGDCEVPDRLPKSRQ